MTKIVLNESGTPAGDSGRLKNVFSLGSFDPNVQYFIDVDTVEQRDESDPENSSTGSLRLPVRSVGRIGRRFFFSTDLRFANFPGVERIVPETVELRLDVSSASGGFRGSLWIEGEGEPVIRTPFRTRREDVLEELSKWSQRQEGRFVFPDGLVEYADENADRNPEIGGGSGLKGKRDGDFG